MLSLDVFKKMIASVGKKFTAEVVVDSKLGELMKVSCQGDNPEKGNVETWFKLSDGHFVSSNYVESNNLLDSKGNKFEVNLGENHFNMMLKMIEDSPYVEGMWFDGSNGQVDYIAYVSPGSEEIEWIVLFIFDTATKRFLMLGGVPA